MYLETFTRGEEAAAGEKQIPETQDLFLSAEIICL